MSHLWLLHSTRCYKVETGAYGHTLGCHDAGAGFSSEGPGGLCLHGSRVGAGGREHIVAECQAPWPACQVSFRLGAHHLPGSQHLRSICGRCGPAGMCMSSVYFALYGICFVYLCTVFASCTSVRCLLCVPLYGICCCVPPYGICSVCLFTVFALCTSVRYSLCVPLLYVPPLSSCPLCSCVSPVCVSIHGIPFLCTTLLCALVSVMLPVNVQLI